MYLVCCQIVAYILTVYSSPSPFYTCISYLMVTELRLLPWDTGFWSAVWCDCNGFAVQYYGRFSVSFTFKGQKCSHTCDRVRWAEELKVCCYCSYQVQWWNLLDWLICLNVFWMSPAISSFSPMFVYQSPPHLSLLSPPRLAWQSSCKYQRQLDLLCSAVDISCPKIL